MSVLTVFSEIGTVIQTLISLKGLSNKNIDYKTVLEEVENRLKALEHHRLIERNELFSIIKKSSNSRIIYSKGFIQNLFGDFADFEVANRIVRKHIEEGRSILDKINFEAEDLVFSSFGTVGYAKYLSDWKGVAIFHSTGDDMGRLFLVRWGIGWYYREQLNHLSFLGFPISDEFSTKETGRIGTRHNFEGGYIEYLKEYDKLRIFRAAQNGVKLVGEHQF